MPKNLLKEITNKRRELL